MAVALIATISGAGETPAPSANPNRLREEIERLVRELDNDRFDVRDQAAKRLEELVAKSELAPVLAEEFQRQLVRANLSFEVRRRLTRWSRQLPAPPKGPLAIASSKELDALVRQIDADSYAARVGAIERLEWLLTNPKLVYPIMTRVKQRLAGSEASTEAQRQLASVWQQARGAWLLSDPRGWDLPPVTEKQIEQWIDALLAPAATLRGSADARRRCETAQRELMDVLPRDQYVPQLKKAIEGRLANAPDADAAARLKELLDWTKPELIAEYWRGGHQLGEQHLIVGVPTLSPGALKPTHFDRADDHVAHYVSGNSLFPGNYPVGEAFPNPKMEECFFHLVNLPTPRRRMAYLYSTRGTEAKRLAEISRRTLDRVLRDKRSLNEPELVMLGELDAAELSRFAGRYFLLIDDSPLTSIGPSRLGGRPSRFGLICARLANDGTKDAMPGLADAIAKDCFLPPNLQGPYRLHWIAAFSIAARDPWATTDAWLAEQVEQKELLFEPVPSAAVLRIWEGDGADGERDPFAVQTRASTAEVGATAAALLLKRWHRSPDDFGLQPTPDGLLHRLHVDGYRFANEAGRKKMRQWCQTQKIRQSSPTVQGG